MPLFKMRVYTWILVVTYFIILFINGLFVTVKSF